MSDDRLSRILKQLAPDADGAVEVGRLCAVSAEVMAMSGAGIMLMADGLPQGSLCTTNDVSTLIEELQYTLGEGPCVDAHQQSRPAVEPDLSGPAVARWPAFTPPAVQAGVRAVFGFPLVIGAIGFGALDFYRDLPGPLSVDQHTDARILAGVAARAVLALQAKAPAGAIGAELEVGSNFRFVVHQASGMIAVQLGISLADALIRLRAYAFGHDRLVVDVATDVVHRRLRLDGDGVDDTASPM